MRRERFLDAPRFDQPLDGSIEAISAPGFRNHLLSMSRKPTPVPTATNDEIARFLGVGDDTRRAILRAFGLPKRRRHAWSELWVRLGLDQEQPDEVRAHLRLGPNGENALWDAARVAEETGVAASTVNRWCSRGVFPAGFPRPVIDHRRKTRLWLGLEVRAFIEPSIYAVVAAQIRRTGTTAPKPARTEEPPATERVVWTGTLEPLPAKTPEEE